MADDIVKRLRQEHVVGWIHPAGECVTCDAADEIERLRADLARLGSFLHPIGEKARRG